MYVHLSHQGLPAIRENSVFFSTERLHTNNCIRIVYDHQQEYNTIM